MQEWRVSLSLSEELWLFCVMQCSVLRWDEPVVGQRLGDRLGPARLFCCLEKWSEPRGAHHCTWGCGTGADLSKFPLLPYRHPEVLPYPWICDGAGSGLRSVVHPTVVHSTLQLAFPGQASSFDSKHWLLSPPLTSFSGQLQLNSSLDLTSVTGKDRVSFVSTFETLRSTEFSPRGNKNLKKGLSVLGRARKF